MADSKLTIAYWHIRGLAAPLRMMVYFAGDTADFKTYDVGNKGSWFEKDKPALKEKNPLINLPYIIHGDVVVTQTDACMNCLGRHFGLHGSTAFQTAAIEQILAQTKDMRNDAVKLFYSKPDAFKKRIKLRKDAIRTVGGHGKIASVNVSRNQSTSVSLLRRRSRIKFSKKSS